MTDTTTEAVDRLAELASSFHATKQPKIEAGDNYKSAVFKMGFRSGYVSAIAASQSPDPVTNADSCQPTPASVQEAAKVLLNDCAALDRMVYVAEDIHCTGVSFNRVVGDALHAIAEGEKP